MMTSMNSMSGSKKSKQRALTIFSILMLSQILILIPSVSADTSIEPTSRTTFLGGDEVITIEFDSSGNQIISSNPNILNPTLEIPRNSTVDELKFGLSTSSNSQSPGQVWLDLNQDGSPEYSFNGTGYGNVSNQTQFSNNNSLYEVSFSQSGINSGPEIILPKNSVTLESQLEIEFLAENGGKWIEDSSIVSMKTSNFDNDLSDELILLSDSWNGEPAIGWLNNNLNNDGYTNISWVETCTYAEEIESADFNGDGFDDILVWTASAGRFCYHLWDDTQNNFTLSNELLGGTMGEEIFVQVADIYGDGVFEVFYADSSGLFGFHEWRGSNGFQDMGTWRFETRSTTGTLVEEGISQFKVGNIMLGPAEGTLVFISDTGTLETLIWDPSISDFEYLLPSFALGSFDTEFIWLADLNGDTFDDIITWGGGNEGNVTYSRSGLGLYSVTSQSGMEAPFGATATDYNDDGIVDILIPEFGASDGDDLTIEGSLKVFTLNQGVITDTSKTLNPRTSPLFSISGDLNGDLLPELIVFCGEQDLGIFIDSWHKFSYDVDGDGIIELSAEGFIQSNTGANGSKGLRVSDIADVLSESISVNMPQHPTFFDTYNNEMMLISSELDLKTPGQISFSNLEIKYDWWNEIENLYDGSGHNLSTLVNSQYMEFGTQNFTIPLVFNSTKAGYLTLEDLSLVTYPGHPDLPDLGALALVSTNVLEDSIELRWSQVTTSQYFDSYKLFRSSTVNAIFPEDYVEIYDVGDYTSDSFADLDLIEGGHYEYVVIVVFSAGSVVLESVPSNVISIDLPSIPRVENVVAVDTPDDQGGYIDVSWDEVDDRYSGYYEVFVRTENFSDTTLLESVALVQNDVTSVTVYHTSLVKDSEGNTIEDPLNLVNEEALWVAVVATNESGSNPFVTATGPVYALNNDALQTWIEAELSFAEVFGIEMLEEELIVGGDQPTVISLGLNYIDSEENSGPVSDAIIMTTLTINPDDESYKVYFNSTTDDAGEAEVVFNWRDIANDTIGVEGGFVEITFEYNGRAETFEKGGLAPSSIDYCQDNGECNDDGFVGIVVPAYFSLLTTFVMVDEFGDATLEISLIAEHEWQQAALLDKEITFKYYKNDGSLTSTTKQSIVNLNGVLEVYIDAMPEGGYVLIEPESSMNPLNPSSTIYLDKFELNATLVEYNDSGQTNLDEDNDFVLNEDDLCPNTPGNEAGQVDSDGCSPSQLEDQIELVKPKLICDGVEQTEDGGADWSIQNIVNSQNSDLDCILENSNEVFLEIDHDDKITVGGIEIGINCASFVASADNENDNVECKFSPTVISESSKESSDPEQKGAEVSITFTWITASGSSQMKTYQYHVDFFLIGDAITVDDDLELNNTGETNNSNDVSDPVINEESTDIKAGILQDPIMLGAIGGGIFSIILVVIVIRYLRGDDDDWDDDWDDDEGEELENPLDRILGRTSGQSFSEPSDEEPFERDNNSGRLSGSAGEEFVRQSQQSNDYEDDPNYSVDEDGTEWWEDEQGQWWYRDPHMDDWEEWNE